VLTAEGEAEVQGESTSREKQQIDACEPEHLPMTSFDTSQRTRTQTKASFASTPNH
jgi:hypothetical protein